LPNCYQFSIDEGITVVGKSSAIKNKSTVNIIQGTAPYNVLVNGIEMLQTSSSTFDVEVRHGDLIEVRTAVFCEGVYLKKVSLFNEMEIFPNPTEDEIHFRLTESVPIEKVAVFNLMGQKLIETSGENNRVNVNSLRKGVYVLHVNTENGTVHSKKIIVKNR